MNGPPPAATATATGVDRFAVALFDGARDREPKPRLMTWRALAQSLTRFRVLPEAEKLRLPAWSPTLYREGATRCAAAVLSISCLVLDFDDGARSLAEARAPWEDWPHLVHTTWSHTLDAPRFRLVVPLEAPVPASGWPRVWHWAHARIGRTADPACKDPCRLYFVPAVRSQDWPRYARTHDPGGRYLGVRAEDLPPTPAEVEADRLRRARDLRPPVQLRAGLGDHAQRRIRSARLNSDPDARAEAGAVLGGSVRGDRVVGVPCPQCKRPSMWWPLVPVHAPKAMCSHRNSCGCTAWLDSLIDGPAT